MGERKREIDPGDRPESSRSVGTLGRRRVTLAKMNSARERALPAACEGEEVGTVPLTRHANQLRSRSLDPLPVVGQSPNQRHLLPLTTVLPPAALALLLFDLT